jgi:hypothetical protein
MRLSVSALVTYCVLPLARRDDGMIVPDDHGAIECANAEAAVRLAEAMTHTHGYVAALACRVSAWPYRPNIDATADAEYATPRGVVKP